MTLLKKFIQSQKSTEEGVKAYVADVTARYASNIPSANLGEKKVRCKWIIEFQSGPDAWTNTIIIPIALLFGHFSFHESKISFETYHNLTSQETRLFKWRLFLRKTFLPLTVFVVLIAALFLAFSIIGFIVEFISHGFPTKTEYQIRVIVWMIVAVLLFVTARKSQLLLRKAGRPPHTTDFTDERIKLDTVSDCISR